MTLEDTIICDSASKCSTEDIGRRHCIPVLYTRGTHYDVGFDVGRTFAGLIHSYLEISIPLNETYLRLYETEQGRKVYEDTLNTLRTRMPQYIDELQGTADGAKVPFHKLFLLHLDDITPNVVEGRSLNLDVNHGCTTICVNQPGAELLCHSEDALSECLNHFYLVSADITGPDGAQEKFTSLCYAGHLPGYTMGYNHHGLIYSVNTISAARLRSGKTPRHFVGRAMLAAKDRSDVEALLQDEGGGIGDACAINMTFLFERGPRVFYNVELGPGESNEHCSRTHTVCAEPGQNLMHCNKYLRLTVPQVSGFIIENSEARMEVLEKYGPATCKEHALEMLGDQSRKDHNVFQENGPGDYVKTIAIGIFDCIERTWTLYDDNPKTCGPIAVLPLMLKNIKNE